MSGERIVPELADAIEGRRRQLGLSIGQLARAAGLTTEGLRPIRRGEVRTYQERTVLNLCRALKWTPDSIDRILRGDSPVEDGEATPVVDLDDRLAAIEEQLSQLARVPAAVEQLTATLQTLVAAVTRGRRDGDGEQTTAETQHAP